MKHPKITEFEHAVLKVFSKYSSFSLSEIEEVYLHSGDSIDKSFDDTLAILTAVGELNKNPRDLWSSDLLKERLRAK